MSATQTASNASPPGTSRRFRFGEFVLSPRQRVLCKSGVPLPLIPRYFDLLHLLVIRRRDAVSKAIIFAEVWTDVIVSDGALAQAVRTLRRTLGDDTREPRFIRTVSRHGYQFVCPDISEEPDDGLLATGVMSTGAVVADTLESLVDRLMATAGAGRPIGEDGDEARDLAERLHTLGTDAALRSLRARPRHAHALAIMRDARWSVATARDVPLLQDPEPFQAVLALVRLRLRDVRHTVAARWAGAAGAGGLGGAMAGAIGGLVLWAAPASSARPQASLALAVVGLLAGGVGAAGIGAGLAGAEALARSRRGLALALCGAVSGALTGSLAYLVLRVLLDSFIGLRLPAVGGLADGLALGAATGLGYGWGTRRLSGGGMAAPAGRERLAVVVVVSACCAATAGGLAMAGHPLVGGLVHQIAQSSLDSQLGLAPLGQLIGEPDFGPVAQMLLGTMEGGTFGAALAWGLTRRPRSLVRR